MKLFFQVLSWVFLPLLMPIYALLLAMYIPSNQDYHFNEDCLYLLRPEVQNQVLYIFTIFCVLFPGVSFLILRRFDLITTVEMDDRKERMIPIGVMLFSCSILYALLWAKTGNIWLPRFIYSLPLSGAVVTAVFIGLNKWKKISIHAAGAGILTGFTLAYQLHHVEYQPWVFTLTILISGLVMTTRRYLGKHTLFELIIGWLTGSLITFVICYYF